MREFFVYILTNKKNKVLYTGMTGNLYERIRRHKAGKGSKFTTRYRVRKLVYYEFYPTAYDAISREKQIKAGSRQDKIDLIEGMNPGWRDLFDELMF
jgi:putative endonuclease